MNTQDDKANDEADRHAQMMQKQREGWDGKRPSTATTQPKVFKIVKTITWGNGNEI